MRGPDNPRQAWQATSVTGMTPRQIRLGVAGSGAIALSVVINLLAMQPMDGRSVRPERAYRGLEALPGTPSTALDNNPAGTGTAAPRAEQSTAVTAAGREELVKAVQLELTRRGYVPGASDGALGLMSRAEIMAFEHDRGLPITADVSLALLAELRSDVPLMVRPAQQPRASAEAEKITRTVQQSLSRMGYQPGPADGLAGEATAAAIRAFETAQQLPQTGRVSGLLLARLIELAGAGQLATR